MTQVIYLDCACLLTRKAVSNMPWWPFTRQAFPLTISASPTQDLEARASAAYFAKQWPEAERLYKEVLAKSDSEGRQVARNMLGAIYERQGHVDEAIAIYEVNAAERSPFVKYFQRLAIIYHRQGRSEDERRILVTALQVAPNPRTRQWFAVRLHKMK